MVAIAGVLFLLIVLAIGAGLIIAAIVGLIICKKGRNENNKKSRLILSIFLWILLGVGIVVIMIPLMYFFLIASNWNRY